MVILENSPETSNQQLSEWDRMINQQFKRQQPALINNLVGANASALPLEEKKKKDFKVEAPKYMIPSAGVAKPGHTKNKYSA